MSHLRYWYFIKGGSFGGPLRAPPFFILSRPYVLVNSDVNDHMNYDPYDSPLISCTAGKFTHKDVTRNSLYNEMFYKTAE